MHWDTADMGKDFQYMCKYIAHQLIKYFSFCVHIKPMYVYTQHHCHIFSKLIHYSSSGVMIHLSMPTISVALSWKIAARIYQSETYLLHRDTSISYVTGSFQYYLCLLITPPHYFTGTFKNFVSPICLSIKKRCSSPPQKSMPGSSTLITIMSAPDFRVVSEDLNNKVWKIGVQSVVIITFRTWNGSTGNIFPNKSSILQVSFISINITHLKSRC